LFPGSPGKKETFSMSYRVFLSHSAADGPWVKWIAENAIKIGIEVYLYEHDAQPGRLIADKVKQAISASDALMVLLTSNSQFSAYVQQEVGFAEASRKLVIPLVQPGVQERSLAMLQGREYVPFDPRDPAKALASLLDYLQRLKEAKEATQARAALVGLGALVVLALLASSSE
jgi:hypothetical protein